MSISIATAQLALAPQHHRLHAWENIYELLGGYPATRESPETLATLALDHIRAVEGMLQDIWDYIHDQERNERETSLSTCSSVDEWEALEVARANPIRTEPKRIDFKAIKDRVDIVDHIGKFTKLTKSGVTFKGRCPLPGHSDSTASFVVYPESRSFYCFGCNAGGDVINFAELHSGAKAETL